MITVTEHLPFEFSYDKFLLRVQLLDGQFKVSQFFSQPMHVAEVFTGQPGVYVSLADTIRSFKGILDGEYDDLPEAAFSMVGSIEDAIEKAKKIT